MDMHQHHEELIAGVTEQYKKMLDSSEQGIYIYLDDVHKVCNKKLADLLGYSSPKEWAAVTEPFPATFVAQESRDEVINAYQMAVDTFVASEADVVWQAKGGELIKSKVMLVPIIYQGHTLALHFVSAAK